MATSASWPAPMPSPASCRAALAPRCRCSEAWASAGWVLLAVLAESVGMQPSSSGIGITETRSPMPWSLNGQGKTTSSQG
jgi:hypothetical protein